MATNIKNGIDFTKSRPKTQPMPNIPTDTDPAYDDDAVMQTKGG